MNKYFIKYKAQKDIKINSVITEVIIEESTIIELEIYELNINIIKGKLNMLNENINLKVIDILIINKL